MQINGFQMYPGCSNVPPMQIQRSRQMEGSGFYPEARICVQLCSCPATVVQLCSCPAKCCQNPALSPCYHVAMVLWRWVALYDGTVAQCGAMVVTTPLNLPECSPRRKESDIYSSGASCGRLAIN